MSAERVSENDLALVKSAMAELDAAQSAVVTAQTLVRFAHSHLGKVYGLKKGDRVEDDGQIVRVEKKEGTET